MTVYSKIKHKSEIHSTNNLTASNVSLTFLKGQRLWQNADTPEQERKI